MKNLCPHCGKEHRLASFDVCLKNPDYDYISGKFGKNVNRLHHNNKIANKAKESNK